MKNLLLSFLLLTNTFSFSQIIQGPQISYVTIDPGSEKITVSWYKSPEANVQKVRLTQVTRTTPTYSGDLVREFYSNSDETYTFNYSNLSSMTSQNITQSLMFGMDAVVGGKSSANLNNGHSTIYATSEFKTCPNQVIVNWTAYKGNGVAVSKYNVYYYKDGKAEILASVAPDEYSYTHILAEGIGDFYYHVEAVFTDIKNKTCKSSSNQTFSSVKLPRLPKYIIGDYATVTSDSTIELSFSIDTECDIKHYIVVRAGDIKGPYSPLDSGDFNNVSSPQLSYTHRGPDIALERNFYKIYAIGECGDTVLSSNACSNIVLNVKQSHKSNTLKWTGYLDWPNGVNRYEVNRSTEGEDPVLIHVERKSAESLDYSDNVDKAGQDKQTVCYSVEAYPNSPKNPASKSQSNKVCITRETRIFVPEAFNPVSRVERNRIFKPEVTFVNVNVYEFKVFDRWGAVMFKTGKITEAWDGTYKGKLVSEGTYVYSLKYENTRGEEEMKHGTFNIIYNE